MLTREHESIPQSGSEESAQFAVWHSTSDQPLIDHSETGQTVRRIISAGMGNRVSRRTSPCRRKPVCRASHIRLWMALVSRHRNDQAPPPGTCKSTCRFPVSCARRLATSPKCAAADNRSVLVQVLVTSLICIADPVRGAKLVSMIRSLGCCTLGNGPVSCCGTILRVHAYLSKHASNSRSNSFQPEVLRSRIISRRLSRR